MGIYALEHINEDSTHFNISKEFNDQLADQFFRPLFDEIVVQN